MRNNTIYAIYCQYNRLAEEWDKANRKRQKEIESITDRLVVLMDAFEGR